MHPQEFQPDNSEKVATELNISAPICELGLGML